MVIPLFVQPVLSSQDIRSEVWAGQFYPRDPVTLSRQIEGFLGEVEPRTGEKDTLKAIIVPHAGYVYSGRVAAHAYALLRDRDVETAVILAPSHRFGFKGCSISTADGYKTPLGIIPVDQALGGKLSDETGFGFVPQAHRQEHAVEVQLPFIQKVLPGAKILPIIMGVPNKNNITRLARGLARVLPGNKAVIIVSTDLSHYLSKKEANERDRITASLIKEQRIPQLITKLESGENIMCGGGGVAAAILAAREWGEVNVDILKYADSADAGAPESGVVGYLSAAITVSEKRNKTPFSLSKKDKEILLALARRSIREALAHNRFPEFAPENSLFSQNRGAFVTLRKRGQLRGCIGFVEAIKPLYQTVMEAAVYAALRDTRFSPVTLDEIELLSIEISVLSPLEKVSRIKNIQVGKHGLVIIKGGRQGLLLPQVAVEQSWNRTTFLRQTCRKAGLSEDAWKSGADIFMFEAVVFGEKERTCPRLLL